MYNLIKSFFNKKKSKDLPNKVFLGILQRNNNGKGINEPYDFNTKKPLSKFECNGDWICQLDPLEEILTSDIEGRETDSLIKPNVIKVGGKELQDLEENYYSKSNKSSTERGSFIVNYKGNKVNNILDYYSLDFI